MSRPRIVLIAAITAVVLGGGVARAQLVITDPAVTLRNVVIAVLKRQVLDTLWSGDTPDVDAAHRIGRIHLGRRRREDNVNA